MMSCNIMYWLKFRILLTVPLVLFVAIGFSQKTVILCKTLIDGTGKTLSDAMIVVDGERIVSAGKKTTLPAGAVVVDLGLLGEPHGDHVLRRGEIRE